MEQRILSFGKGWERSLAILSGILVALALPPFSIFPLAFLAFPAFLVLLDRAQNRRQAFSIGFWFGFGHFLLLLHWIVLALLTDVDKYAWLTPLALLGPALGLAPISGLSTLATFVLAPCRTPRRALALAATWSAGEWLRGHLFTGFPWMPIGHVWDPVLSMLQSASLWGVYGLGLITLLLATSPYAILQPCPRRKTIKYIAITSILLLAGWGHIRLITHPTQFDPRIRLRIVQPGISQHDKADMTKTADIFRQHLTLSAQSSAAPPNLVLWPETAVIFPLAEDEVARQMIASLLPDDGLLITGTLRRQPQENAASLYFNSLAAINRQGLVVASYDKFHLVPFGEYMPAREILKLDAIAASNIDFSEGPGPRTLHFPDMPSASPLICFEAIFPGNVTSPEDRPDVLLALTNDGWFGHSSGPYQHFAMARMRSIEEGIPLLRAANTGISGVVDPLGRITAHLDLGKTGVLDAKLPKPMVAEPPYARFGNTPFLALLLGIFFYMVVKQRR
ncbi:MAG: apolipoprotein N-acyltransferase [Alphaproteobacteria bacterium GWF2_58_20]|nr:MAG: apolipoprotein N-acyltransferase [Alphaproteobacteria bacterium GWF2_58_20]